jgi:hypothetical protein
MINLINQNMVNMTCLWKRIVLQGMLSALTIFILTYTISASANPSPTQPNLPATTENAVQINNEQRRALMEKAILAEKYKINTQARDIDNKQRANGKIFSFDLVLGAFLTLLWAVISLFIAAQFFPDKESLQTKKHTQNHRQNHKQNNKFSTKVFHGSAALVPLMLLWVSIYTGYVSWWLTFALSGLIYWSMSWIFKRIEKSSLQPG